MQSHHQGYQDYIFNSQQPILNVTHTQLCNIIQLYRFILLVKTNQWRIIFDLNDGHLHFAFSPVSSLLASLFYYTEDYA